MNALRFNAIFDGETLTGDRKWDELEGDSISELTLAIQSSCITKLLTLQERDRSTYTETKATKAKKSLKKLNQRNDIVNYDDDDDDTVIKHEQ